MNMRILAGVTAVLSLAAFSKDGAAPFVKGQGSSQYGQWVLTAQQLAAADKWLLDRKPNCLAGFGSPPTPSVRLHLVRSDGSSLELGFYSQPGYATAVETRIGKNLCHYRGSEMDVIAFRRAVGEPR